MGLTFNLGRVSPSVFTDSSLNVGIGAAPSGSYKLEVTGTSRVSGAALFSSSVTIPSSSGIVLGTTGSTDGIISSVSGTVGLRLRINTTDALVIASSGAATFSSSVDGTIFNSTSNAFRFSGSNALSLVTLNSQNVVKVNAAGYWGVQLVGANDQGIVINNTGLVGIGTTAPLKILHLAKGGNDNGILFTDDASGNYRNEINNNYSGAAAASNTMVFKVCNATTTGQTTVMTLNGAGSIGAPSGTNIYNASDVRFKQNITTIENGLNKIIALNPVKFNWIDGFEPSEDGKDMLGFIAQEVQNVIPEAVENFGNNSVTIGEIIVENPLRVNEKFIIPVLVKAIQELSAQNQDLKSRLDKAGL